MIQNIDSVDAELKSSSDTVPPTVALLVCADAVVIIKIATRKTINSLFILHPSCRFGGVTNLLKVMTEGGVNIFAW